MKKERWYVSGPMSGLPGMNKPAFHAETARLRALGYYVINPAESDLPEGSAWEDYMRADIKLLMDCTAIMMLPGYEKSRGAMLEYRIAQELGMTIALAAGKSPFESAPHFTDWAAA